MVDQGYGSRFLGYFGGAKTLSYYGINMVDLRY